jgi:hypothetical protein
MFPKRDPCEYVGLSLILIFVYSGDKFILVRANKHKKRCTEWTALSLFICLFICGLFNDAISNSDCTELNDRMINKYGKCKGQCWNRPWRSLCYQPDIRLDKLRKVTKSSVGIEGLRVEIWTLNPEHEPGMLNTQPRSLTPTKLINIWNAGDTGLYCVSFIFKRIPHRRTPQTGITNINGVHILSFITIIVWCVAFELNAKQCLGKTRTKKRVLV